MNKQCKHCNNDFEVRNNRGSEQLYCSKECSRKASAERYKQNLITKHLQDESTIKNGEQRTISQQENRTGERTIGRNFGICGTEEIGTPGSVNRNEPIHNTISIGEYIRVITENANIFNELKWIKEKVHDLEVERGELLAELENYETEEEKEENEELGMFSGIVDAYKKEPTATISFAKDMIFEFLKPKTKDNAKQQATTT
jgi:hypothetical protein